MEQYHGQASGIFGCDEHLAGNMPSRGELFGRGGTSSGDVMRGRGCHINLPPSTGTELCTVVEAMYSYEVLFGVQGDCAFGEGVVCKLQ